MNHKQRILGLLLAATAACSQAATLLTEGFDDVGTLAAAGWVMTNNSTPGGSTGWFQGNAGVFPAQSGAADAYIAANFLAAPAGGAISLWLIGPQLTFGGPATLDFSIRLAASLPEQVEVYFSPGGAGVDVGSTPASTGTFGIVGSIYAGGPTAWQPTSFAIGGAGANSGRFAFRYVVSDTNEFGDYIGIDSVSVTAVPEPGPAALLALGLAALGLRGRRAPGRGTRWTAAR
jgi:MYXO-CTERM domain-containing protein